MDRGQRGLGFCSLVQGFIIHLEIQVPELRERNNPAGAPGCSFHNLIIFMILCGCWCIVFYWVKGQRRTFWKTSSFLLLLSFTEMQIVFYINQLYVSFTFGMKLLRHLRKQLFDDILFYGDALECIPMLACDRLDLGNQNYCYQNLLSFVFTVSQLSFTVGTINTPGTASSPWYNECPHIFLINEPQ